MKKIIFLLALTLVSTTSLFAIDQLSCTGTSGSASPSKCKTTTSCANPATGFSDVSGYTCGNTNDSNPTNDTHKICSFIANGGLYQDHAVTNCFPQGTTAPVNAGLIFLIIAGGGLGAFMFKRASNKSKGQLAV